MIWAARAVTDRARVITARYDCLRDMWHRLRKAQRPGSRRGATSRPRHERRALMVPDHTPDRHVDAYARLVNGMHATSEVAR